MPQMSPLSWTTLYLFFSILFSIFIFLNYTHSLNKPNMYPPLTETLKFSLNWKW
nr:ATP synthase F0 subunit 8 [Phyllozelus siccus siccus]